MSDINNSTEIEELAPKILRLLEGQKINVIGASLTEALAIFLAGCELERPGSGQSAIDLLFTGTTNLFNTMNETIAEMRVEGFSNEKIKNTLLELLNLTEKEKLIQ